MKLSIAIPAYNAEKTLERTVRSILAQTFTDFEVLIVNNGSKDATGDIARKLAADDSRIQVFDVYPNIWGYGARLYAWKRAKGEYIATVDADDFIDPDMYKTMLDLAAQHNLDVVECDFIEDPGEPQAPHQTIRPSTPEPTFALTQGLVFRTYVYPTLIDVGKSAYTWNKIYRNQYDFSTWVEGVFGSYEDLIHNLQLFRPVQRYAHVPMPFYHYAPNPSSVTRNYSADRIEQFVTTIKMKRQLVRQYGIRSDAEVMRRWIRNDAKNGIISALTAGRLPWCQRLKLAWQIVRLPEVGLF